MVVLVEVRIGNILDDSTRSEIFVYDSNDTDIEKNLSIVIEHSIELNDYSKEYFIDYKKIKPHNISADKGLFEKVKNIFND